VLRSFREGCLTGVIGSAVGATHHDGNPVARGTFEKRAPRASDSGILARTTGLERATSCVTGRRSNQLNYAPRNIDFLPLPRFPFRGRQFPKLPENAGTGQYSGITYRKIGVTDGSFWRSKARMVTLIVPLLCPRPLPYKPLPDKAFASTTACLYA
jgi:hypothetical protein